MLLGDNDYPFPYPLVKAAAGWQFDAKSGAEEIVNRRIGANELAAINVCLAYVDAQREYVLRDRDNNWLARVRAEAREHAGHAGRSLLGDEGR